MVILAACRLLWCCGDNVSSWTGLGGRARVSKRARMPRCGMQGTCGAMPFNTHPAGSALPCLIRLLCAEWTCDAPLGTGDAKGATMIGARHGHKEAMQESNNKSSKLHKSKTSEQEMAIQCPCDTGVNEPSVPAYPVQGPSAVNQPATPTNAEMAIEAP